MITPCKTLSVFVYSRLRLRTCVCIDVREISLRIYALMPRRALNLLCVCVCASFARHLEAKSLAAEDFKSKPFPLQPLGNTIRELLYF